MITLWINYETFQNHIRLGGFVKRMCDEVIMIDGVEWEVYKGLDYNLVFKNDSFVRCIFMNCNLTKSVFAHCEFETKFIECDMTDVEFFECGNGVHFDKCILKGIKFKQSLLTSNLTNLLKEFTMMIKFGEFKMSANNNNCEIVKVKGKNGNLVEYKVYTGVDFSRCIFNDMVDHVIFNKCKLNFTIFKGGLNNVEFQYCLHYGMKVYGTIHNCRMPEPKVTEFQSFSTFLFFRKLSMKIIQNGIERETFPSETIIRGATIYDVYNNIDFSYCKFLDCSLQNIQFINCNFKNAAFDQCRINAEFYACNMRDCRFIQCKVFSISFYHSTTDGMVF